MEEDARRYFRGSQAAQEACRRLAESRAQMPWALWLPLVAQEMVDGQLAAVRWLSEVFRCPALVRDAATWIEELVRNGTDAVLAAAAATDAVLRGWGAACIAPCLPCCLPDAAGVAEDDVEGESVAARASWLMLPWQRGASNRVAKDAGAGLGAMERRRPAGLSV